MEAQVIEASPWTPALIASLFAGLALVIGALGKVIVDLKTAKSKAVEAVSVAAATSRKVEEARRSGETAGQLRDNKLDEIKMLVDGRFSEVLDHVAHLTRAIANQTGNHDDIQAADEAEAAADKQRLKVREAAMQRKAADVEVAPEKK